MLKTEQLMRYFIICACWLMSTQVVFSQDQAALSVPEADKEAGIAQFKSDVIALVDSSLYYFDQVDLQLADGLDYDKVEANNQAHLQRLAKAIDLRLRAFQQEAAQLDLTEAAYDRANFDMMKFLQKLRKRHQQVADKGFKMH